MLLKGPAGHWGTTWSNKKEIPVFQICIFRIEINRKCSNTHCHWLLRTTYVICNMKSFSQNDKVFPLCLKTEDTQEHCMECPKLKHLQNKSDNQIQYNHIFSKSEQEQKAVTNLFLRILETRQSLIQEGLPGAVTLYPILYT